LKQTFTLPESILFVCDFASNYLLAAGKRTLYICDTQTANIIREVVVDEDITGTMRFSESKIPIDTCHKVTLTRKCWKQF
jgi:hypothetical protein